MLRPRWRKLLADLYESKARTLLVVLSIAVGVFAVGAIAGAYMVIPQAMSTSYAAANPANIVLVTDPFDDDLLEAVGRMEGVASAVAERSVSVRMKVGPDTWARLDLAARSDLADMQVDILHLVKGSDHPADQQLLLSDKMAERYGIAPGQTVEIELPDGTRKQLPVAGTVRDLTSGKRGALSDGVGYVTTGSLDWLHQPQSYDQLSITLAEKPDDKAHIAAMADAIKDRVEKSGCEVYQTDLYQKNKHPEANIIAAVIGVLGLLGVLLAFLSGSLIANTLSALLTQQLRQIGVMKLVGGRRGQIVGLYLALILVYGLLALVLAVPPAGKVAYLLADMAADRINFLVPQPGGLPLIPQAVLLQAAMAMIIPVLAGTLPVLQGSGITVQKAIASVGLSGETFQKRSGRMGRRWRGLSRPLLVSIRNTFRRKGRVSLTLFTLALGGAIFIAVFSVRIALNQTVEQSTRYFRADVNLDMARLYRINEVEQDLMTVPGVEAVEAWAAARAEILRPDGSVGPGVSIMAPPADSRLVEPVLLEGRWLLPEDERAITVNEAFWSQYPGLSPGDTLRLRINDHDEDWTVVGIFRFTGADELYAFTNYESVAGLLHQTGRAALYRIVAEDHDVAAEEQLSAEIDARFRNLGYQVSQTEAGGSLAKTIADMLWILIAVLLAMALLTALVGSIGLMGTLSMNVLERTREIGVLRAIGAHDRIIMRLVVVEGLLIGLISYVAASLLSFPITVVLSNVTTQAIFNTPARPTFAAEGFALWLLVVLILSVVASVIPARSACRLTIREVLAYE